MAEPLAPAPANSQKMALLASYLARVFFLLCVLLQTPGSRVSAFKSNKRNTVKPPYSHTAPPTRLQLRINPNGDAAPNNEAPNKRKSLISPDDLDSLFGPPPRRSGSSGSSDASPSAEYYDEGKEEEVGEGLLNEDGDEDGEEWGGDSSTLGFSSEMSMMPPPTMMEDAVDMEEGDSSTSVSFGGSSSSATLASARDPAPDLCSSPEDLLYAPLDSPLQGRRRIREVQSGMSLAESAAEQARIDRGVAGERRSVAYEPRAFKLSDPMLYGAYRRWKIAEEPEERGTVKNRRAPSSKGRKKTGIGSPSKPGGRKLDGDKSGGKDGFYNALKKLSSGPGGGGSTGTGIAEPPPGKMAPVTPKKAPAPGRRNQRKIITPRDIDSLFAKPQAAGQEDEEEDEEEEEEDEEDEEKGEEGSDNDLTGATAETRTETEDAEAVAAIFRGGGLVSSTEYKPFRLLSKKEAPEWLVKAEADRKAEKKALAGKKKSKKLTGDWRFWAAIVATAGFASAFWSVYQQTGGGGGGSELII